MTQAPEFLQKIDWTLLREQKSDLYRIITDIEENAQYDSEEDREETHDKWKESIEGVIHLIDAIQDYGVDVMGLSDKEVFNLTPEDEDDSKFFYIDGYWKDDHSEFEGYKVSTFDDSPEDESEDKIFFFGLSESAIIDAISKGEETAHDFVITSYHK